MKKKEPQNKNINELIYRLQKQRLLHPMYIVFTKEGFLITIMLLFLLFNGGVGLKTGLFFVGLYWWVYKYRFDYLYTQEEKVWLLSVIVYFFDNKIKKPFSVKPIIDDYK